MTGNPLSGHTAANETSMVGSGVFTDSLEDGEHITSPSLTNMLEGVHGNGILLEEDTATAASNRNTPEDLPGVCEQVTNSYTTRVTGGHAILDGVLYQFANGPGSTQDIAFTTTSDHKRATYSALASGQEALIVVYVSTNTAEECITWEMGTPVTTASNTYPTTPSAFLSNPMTSGLDVTQSVVLAVIRVVYSATGGDLNISITESNDKRVFVRPTPMYLTPVTTGVVGNKTAVDSHTALDGVNSDAGDLTTSRMGAIWQSYNSDGDATLYYSAKDSSDNRHTHVLGPVGYVSASPSATTTFTFNEGQVFVLNPSTAIQFNPSGTFPLGHKVFVTNEAAHDTNAVTFDNAGIGIVLKGKEAGVFVYTGSAWKNVMLASGAISPNGHGANGLIQLSDGAGGFTSDSNLEWTASPAELTVTGKLTVTGLIDPTGLVLDEKANVAATGHTTVASKGLLWVKDDAPNRLYFTDDAGTDKKVIHATDSVTELSDVSAVGSGSIITSAERTKLTGIETGATADQTDAEIRAAVEAATDSNVFTDADHTKLDNIEASATADQTGAEIKAAYELEANAFTDAQFTKLSGIETSATADQTDAEIRAAVEAATDSNVFTDADHTKLNGIEASADVTDATNVTAAGALMDSEVTNLAQVKAFDSADYATAAQGALADSALQSETDPVFSASQAALITDAGSTQVITPAERTTLGTALQDASVFATAAQGTTADNALPKAGGAMTGAITTNSTFDGRDVATDGTKLDTIEANADVTDATNVAAAGALMKTATVNSNSSPAASAADSGEYFYITSGSFTLPNITSVGEQYVVLNNKGSSLSIGKDASDSIVGATSIDDGKVATIVAVTTSTWFVVG